MLQSRVILVVAILFASSVGTAIAQPGQATVAVRDAEVTEFTVCSDFIIDTSLEFELTTDGPDPVDVEYAAEAGTAGPDDFEPVSGTVTIQPGSRTVVTVPVAIDDRTEPDETVLLRVVSAEGAGTPDAPGIGTIRDDDDPAGFRLAGATRVETALELWPPHTYIPFPSTIQSDATLVSADGAAEAVIAGPLRDRVLFTTGDGVHPAVREHLEEADPPQRVTIVGDEDAVPAAVAGELLAMGVGEVVRHDGPDAAAIGASVAAAIDHDGHAYLIGDAATVDGVSVSSLATALRRPVLVTAADSLTPATRDALDAFTAVTIVGGRRVVSDGIVDQLRAMGLAVDRLAGTDRYATAVAVADAAADEGLREDIVWVVSGGGFADVATAGAAAGIGGGCYRPSGGMVMLVDGQDLDRSTAARDWLGSRGLLTRVRAVGGTAAISDEVFAEVLDLTGVPPLESR